MPAISVAIACYNAQQFIGDTLKGLCRQSRQPHEILIVDDGSTDNSRAVIGTVDGTTTEIRVIVHKANLGIAAARNTAWQQARGDIIVYLDADAIPHPDYLQILEQCYQDPCIDGAGGRAIEYVRRTPADRWRAEVLFQHWGQRVRHDVPFLFGICASYRRKILSDAGGFDPAFKFSGEDMDLGFRLHRSGRRLMYIPTAVVRHMRSDDHHSIQKMAYRHCYGGFVAQRKNNCFHNKITLIQSLRLFLRQVSCAARSKEDMSYSIMTLRLHGTILRAWIDAQRTFRGNNRTAKHNARYGWEGYALQPAQPVKAQADHEGDV